jgi:mitochondrial fission protein ELM1
VWVTEDSVSMLHEAVTAAARVGVLPVPRLDRRSRVVRAVEELITAGHACPLGTWRRNGRELPPPKPLHETARCADWILARLFPKATA